MTSLLPLAIAGLLATGAAQARGIDHCGVNSSYDMALGADALVFTREAVAPMRVEMRNGALRVDGQPQVLDEADQLRVARFEREVRAMVPEVKAIAIDAVGVASEAVVQVAGAFSGDAEPRSADGVRRLAAQISERIAKSSDTAEWRDEEFDAAIDRLAAEVVPMIAGDIAGAVMAATLGGDTDEVQAIERRAATLEQEVETRIAARSAGLEARVKALCPRVQALDALESEMEWRGADGKALDLVVLDGAAD